jgi:hypothetical protein
MKRTMLLLSLILAATSAFAGHDNFDLTAHISSIGHEQRYSSNKNLGAEHTVHTYNLTINGDPVTYEMVKSKGGTLLQVGQDYKAQWKKLNQILEVQYTDEKGKEKTESMKVLEESQP